jgi:alginate O-acetyltransferase complex protein AlgI
MLFPTFDFAIFFCVVFIGAWLLNRRVVAWKLWILAASYYFYAYWDWRFCFLLLASTLIAHVGATGIVHARAAQAAMTRSTATPRTATPGTATPATTTPGTATPATTTPATATRRARPAWSAPLATLLEPVARTFEPVTRFVARTAQRLNTPRAWLVGSLVGLLGLLGYFKYYGFFAVNAANLLSHVGLSGLVPLLTPTLPIAISFFTFMAISYVVDVYRGNLELATPIDLATYLSFFPHLVAGPIVRGSELLPQLRRPRNGREIDFSRAALLIMGGLFKKVVVSAYLSSNIVQPVFNAPKAHSAPEVLVAVWAYAIEIYADFSGYTDIAIGIALLLGIRFPVNFDAPYTARSLQDFWRRWHITLSRWLRDYLYVPLGGNRGSSAETARNIMVTMVLGGLWHGANWTFVAWGALHGTGQVVGHLRRTSRERRGLPAEEEGRYARVRQRFLTFQFVSLGWLFFNASSMSNAYQLLGRLVHGWSEPSPLVTPLLVFVIVAMLVAQYVPPRIVDRAVAGFGQLAAPVQAIGLGGALLVTTTLMPAGVQPFIYYHF